VDQQAISSTPQACGLVFHHPRQRHASEVVAQNYRIGAIRSIL
jgi:hypothetical protein